MGHNEPSIKRGMNALSGGNTNHLLGYPAGARLLIINADDFGMCHAVNEAIMRALPGGIVTSTTVMVPCPWSRHALGFLAGHPDISFGVHLTVICDWAGYRWGPVTCRERVPSLVNRDGHFYNFDQMPAFLAGVDLGELATEFRAQIETVLATGLKPTHLDWHCLRLDGWDAVSEVMLELAREYELALRVIVRSQIARVRSLGLPANDGGFLDSYLVDSADKVAHYTNLLRDLPAGLSEWAVHPGFDFPELAALHADDSRIRRTDYDFLMSQKVKDVISEEGIILLDYRALQDVWRARKINL